jgi:uncharacterized OsmC-like protein
MPETPAFDAMPIVFPVAAYSAPPPEPIRSRLDEPRMIGFRTEVRALSGMQKEAVVWPLGKEQPGWRMFSDEGPYLNGTDLAPFPLGFFAAGLQFSFLETLVKRARVRGIEIESLESVQDTWYTMTGSAIRGDMTGGAKPVDLLVKIRADASGEAVLKLLREAEQMCAAHAVMRDVITNTFSCRLNAAEVPVAGVSPSATGGVADPAASFEQLSAIQAVRLPQPIISKIAEAQRVHGVAGGVASSLQSEQKRTLNVHGEARVDEDGLMETRIQLRSPVGSTFRFVGQVVPPEGQARVAPSGLAYLSAGVAFCFMTQLGRYAHILKYPIEAYRLAQFSLFRQADPGTQALEFAAAAPVDTHLFLEGDLQGEAAAQSLRMSEQTCFLHAAMRGGYPSRIAVEVNGKVLTET